MRREQVEPAFLDVPGLPHDPWSRRAYHRLTTVRSTSIVAPISQTEAPLYLGRLTPYYANGAVALPKRVHANVFDTISGQGKRSQELQPELRKLCVNVFQAPSGRVLYALTFDTTVLNERLVALLEDCYYESIKVTLHGGQVRTIGELVDEEIQKVFPVSEWNTEPDLHQILFLSPVLSGLATAEDQRINIREDFLRSLVYRVHVPQREGFTAVQFPPELNRGLTAVAAVGSFVSVLCGHQDYVENCAILSAAAIVSATTELRSIQESILDSFAVVRDKLGTLSRPQRSQMLGSISGQLARHEMNLSQHVESVADIGIWIPSLRVEDYHRTLVSSVRLMDRSQIVGNSIHRLTSITSARTQVLLAEEQQLQDHRRRSWALVVGLLTTVAIPASFILAFFGISAPEVDQNRSIFDLHRYAGVYLFAFGMVGLSVLVVALFWVLGHPSRRRKP
ncbi:MAG TPA: hypothetical protein VGR06_23135 [Actinophytocola sp.]|uniref:hypothetical protein n=1 Tax=Actinophytocola sp. TaxID=1872138 RepID=UPI002E0AACCA|nr:hypothetical protein [Actinophytocola sp.]